MKTEPSQDKYDEVLNDLKQEKMNWDFNDFIGSQQDEQPATIFTKKKNKTPVYYWAAASVVLLLSLFLGRQFFENPVQNQDQTIAESVKNQKNNILQTPELAYHATDSVGVKRDSMSQDSINEQASAEKVLDQILPRRGRLKKEQKPRFADNNQPKINKNQNTATAPEYQDNFVIINGHKIKSEQEALDVTEYSFRMFSEKISQTIATTEVLDYKNND